MLKLTFRTTILRNSFIPLNRGFAEKLKVRKDYYQILGIPRSSSEEEIKTAYRNLAKRYHPDVNVGAETHEPNVEKFRDVAEAYAVLSNKTLRLDYDLRMRQYPEMVYNAEKMKNMKESQPDRDKTGNTLKPSPLKGSYAEYRMEKLKELRKQFNVDDSGLYKGGVPRRGKGSVRGNAWAPPGMYHNEWYHNEWVHDQPHARPHVSRKEATEHKRFMNVSRDNFLRFRPYYKMDEIEKDSQYYITDEHRFLFWVPIVILLSIGSYFLYQRIQLTRKFHHLEKKIESLKPYEFIQQGPLVLHANQFKQMEKFQNREEYHKWIENDLRSFG